VICVLAFRKGVVGEIHAFVERRRMRRRESAKAVTSSAPVNP
jgi:hypothetical protein